jgi:hypothetical protein
MNQHVLFLSRGGIIPRHNTFGARHSGSLPAPPPWRLEKPRRHCIAHQCSAFSGTAEKYEINT